MKIIFSILLSVFMMINADAKIHQENVDYKDGATTLEGYLAYDDSHAGKMPAVIVVHEWWGLTDYIKMRCDNLAKLGYVAFAADIYGKGIRPTTSQEAGKQATIYGKDRNLMRERINAALDQVKKYDFVDADNIAAIGYCFGGGVVMELACTGAGLKGFVTFHGSVSVPDTENIKNIKGKVLICHGANDPFVTASAVNKLMDQMNSAGVNYEVNFYSNTVHAFTNPASGNDPSKGAAYNKQSDERSWLALKNFLKEIF